MIPEIPGVPGYFIEGESPSVVESLGTAFAYTLFFKIIFTFLVVQSLLLCGCVKTAVKVAPNWA